MNVKEIIDLVSFVLNSECAVVTKIENGNTILVDIDYGFDHWRRDVPIILEGVNTGSTAALENMIPVGTEVIISMYESGEQGKYLGTIYRENVNINQAMVEQGHAVEVGD